ncbi:MAG: HAD-IIIA family hydrolase [Anaerolineaceae bacterium]|nr:HAD-IIIA family hydrolase [Anaerolineaceae bacterium]
MMTNGKIKVLLFDFGSTLVYFHGNWDQVMDEGIDAMARNLQAHGVNVDLTRFPIQFRSLINEYYIKRDVEYIEYSTDIILSNYLEDEGFTDVPSPTITSALDCLYETTGTHWLLDPEAIPLLQSLLEKGYRLGMISNAAYANDVWSQLNRHHLTQFFEQVLISADVGIRKPHHRIFEKALHYFQCQPEEAVMIGDTLSADILGSRRAGMKNIWIARWASAPTNHVRDDAIIPDRTVQYLNQIPAILDEWMS